MVSVPSPLRTVWSGSSIVEAKALTFSSTGPKLRPMSIIALRARSSSHPSGSMSRRSPTASTSSVKGVGAKKPVPAEIRATHSEARARIEIRGLR